MSQDDDQLVERVAMIIAKHVFTERASEWPYAGKEEEIRGRLQRAARAALSAMPQRDELWIGDMMIRHAPNGIWIGRRDGEGGEFATEHVERVIAQFYRENF